MDYKTDKKKKSLFSPRERRGVLLLIPLIAVLGWIIWSASRVQFDGSAEVIGDAIAQGDTRNNAQSHRSSASETSVTQAFDRSKYSPEPFDPNTVTYEELRRMGVAASPAAALIRARERGKVYQIAEDFATTYGVTDSVYSVFKPYIIIGEQYRIKPYADSGARASSGKTATSRPAPNATTTQSLAPFNPNELSAEGFEALGFSSRQASVIVNFRTSMGGFRSADDFARCYVVSDEMYARLKDFIVIPASADGNGAKTTDGAHDIAPFGRRLVDINTADSLTLVSVGGIGPRTAQELIAYRTRLGGFHNVRQLADLKVVTERNYELMCREIWADSCEIQKIDINFASPKVIAIHPYVTDRKLRKILKNRQLKGGWRTIEDMIEDNTLTAEEAAQLSPYLQFGPRQP